MIEPLSCPSPLADFIAPVLGLTAWEVRQGHGSFLTFEFGQPKLTIELLKSERRRSAYVKGQWHLWIYCCHWRITQAGKQLAWSEDSSTQIARAAGTLNGQNLTGIDVRVDEGRSMFTFDLGGALETWPYGDDPTDQQWMFYSVADVFVYSAAGQYAQHRPDLPREQVAWAPLR